MARRRGSRPDADDGRAEPRSGGRTGRAWRTLGAPLVRDREDQRAPERTARSRRLTRGVSSSGGRSIRAGRSSATSSVRETEWSTRKKDRSSAAITNCEIERFAYAVIVCRWDVLRALDRHLAASSEDLAVPSPGRSCPTSDACSAGATPVTDRILALTPDAIESCSAACSCSNEVRHDRAAA